MLGVVGTLPPPKLNEGFETFANSYTITWLPRTSHVDILHKLSKPAPKDSPPAAGIGGRTPAPTKVAKSDKENARTRASNRNHDPRVMGETPLARRIRQTSIADALAAHGGKCPVAANGGARCLSCHLKGKCYSDCTRQADHIVLPTDEADQLLEWCAGLPSR